jgi:catalase
VATTPKEALGKIDARFGVHARHRALHAKGVICKGSFTATPEAATLTRAGHMTGETIPTTVRISNGGGDPTVPDYEPDVRGLATAFHLPDGTRTDILAQTLPWFPFRDQEGFLDVLAISKPGVSALMKFPGFAFRYPKAIARLPATTRILNSRASFAARRFYPFHAYKWIDADGDERYVRYIWLPTIEEPEISKAEAKRRGPNYLFDDLEQRLAREPVRWDLDVQIAGDGDDPNDPSSAWPDERERVIVGRLEVTAIDPDADDGIVMDPMRVVDGIEPSGDPALLYRPPVYDLSHTRRTAK